MKASKQLEKVQRNEYWAIYMKLKKDYGVYFNITFETFCRL